MIGRLLNSKANTVAVAAMLVAFSSLFSRLLGILRDRILAGTFGAGPELDAYYAAFRLPDTLYNLLIIGALSAGFIPLFAKRIGKEQGNEEAWRLANNLLNLIGVVMLAIAGLAAIFAEPLMGALAPGFDTGQLQQTVALSRIMLVSPLLLGLSGLVGGVLQSFKRFFVYSLSPIFYNLGIIFGALWLVPLLGMPGLAWGVVLGALMHLLIQLPTLFHLGYRYEPSFDFRAPEVKQVVSLMIPRTLALAVTQVDLVVSTAIASTLAAGSLAVFNFANNLQYFPIGIFGISFATAVFPSLAQSANEPAKMVGHFSKVERQILFFVLPATSMLLVLREPIIQVVLGAGAFDMQAVKLTADTLAWFSISLFAQASIPLLARMFYAREDSRRPFYIAFATVAFDIAAALTLSRWFGVAGIAIAFSISSCINFSLLLILLHRQIGSLDGRRILSSAAVFSVAAVFAGLAAYYAKSLLSIIITSQGLTAVFFQGAIAGLIGIASYFIICLLFRNEEAIGMLTKMRNRISSNELTGTDQSEARGI